MFLAGTVTYKKVINHSSKEHTLKVELVCCLGLTFCHKWCFFVFFQPVMSCTWTVWIWRVWQDLRLWQRQSNRHYSRLRHSPPLLYSSKCPIRELRWRITRESEFGVSPIIPPWNPGNHGLWKDPIGQWKPHGSCFTNQLSRKYFEFNRCAISKKIVKSNTKNNLGNGVEHQGACHFLPVCKTIHVIQFISGSLVLTKIIDKYFVLFVSRLFFRRHYPVNTVTFCGMDPEDRK